jgi:CDGSH iron-sulfur domain-containing protein 3
MTRKKSALAPSPSRPHARGMNPARRSSRSGRVHAIPAAHQAVHERDREHHDWVLTPDGLRMILHNRKVLRSSRWAAPVGGYDSITHITSEEGTMKGIVAQKGPFAVDLEAGKTYYWCACGTSKHQPFCDGSHKGTAFTPQAHTAATSGTAYLCGCKQTNSAPLCDGSHATA